MPESMSKAELVKALETVKAQGIEEVRARAGRILPEVAIPPEIKELLREWSEKRSGVHAR